MKKYMSDCFSKFQTVSSNELEPVKFTNDLVIQVDSDDSKSSKKNNQYRIFFLVFVKTKIQAFSKYVCECFFFCRKAEEEDNNCNKIVCNYSPEKTSTRGVLQEIPLQIRSKKTLILDLDETLVHSFFTPTKCDLYLEVPYQEKMLSFFINIRAGIEQFFDVMSDHYEIIVYTASMSEYADKVIEYLDKKKQVSQRLFRESCTFYKRGFVKDLSKIGRNLKDIVIIDNSAFSFCFQPENGIQIKPFFDDKSDRELINLIPFLIFLSKTYDVRPINIWKEKFNDDNPNFTYFDMNNKKQIYDKGKEQKIQENINERKAHLKKQKLQIDIKENKKRNKNLSLDYGEAESAEKMKKNAFEDYDLNKTDTYDGFDRKLTADFELIIKDKQSNFDNQRYNVDTSNINSPIIKKEINFENPNHDRRFEI